VAYAVAAAVVIVGNQLQRCALLVAYLTVSQSGCITYFGTILSDWKYVSRLVVQLTYQCCRGHSGVRGNEITDKLATDVSVQKFVGPEPSLGVSRQNIRR